MVRGDGVRETVLRVSIADRFGNPVPAEPAVASARGRVLGVAARRPGEFDVRYVPPAVDRPAVDALVARIGAVRATLAPVVAPPVPALAVEARAGAALETAGRFGGAAAGVAAERPADVAFAVRHGVEAAWRLEAGGLSGGHGAALATLLAGASARRPGGRADWSGSATAGVLLAPGEVAPAARLALSLGLARAGVAPFVELAVLGARAGAPGRFAAVGLSAGLRVGLEGHHGHDPDCR